MRRKKTIIIAFMIIMIIGATLIQCIDVSKDTDIPQTDMEEYTDETDVDTFEGECMVSTIDANILTGKACDYVTKALDKKIDDIINSMTVEEKVGQMFFIKNDGRFNASLLDTIPAGGIILFAGDIKGLSKNTFMEKIQKFQDASPYPLLIGTDEEGGIVNRVSVYSTYKMYPFKSSKEIYKNGGYDAIVEDTIEKSQLLLGIGINVNFAPVCDVSPNTTDYMYSRSFSGDPYETAEYTSLVVETMKQEKIGCVLKHFPGYGSNGDTHKETVYDERSFTEFEEGDFLPFEAGIKAGADCVLMSHNIVTCMDEKMPASISKPVHEILREHLQFDGVIITDDLMMGGVENYASREELAIVAVEAGNDMLLSTYYEEQYNAVLDAVKRGEISMERIEESVRRIIRWKMKLGFM